MNGPEIHPAVDAKTIQAQRNAEAFSEATRRAVANATAFAEVLKQHRRKRAVIALVIRVMTVVAIDAFVCLCSAKHWMVAEVSIALLGTAHVWLSVWAGAWVQYMWGRDGVLR